MPRFLVPLAVACAVVLAAPAASAADAAGGAYVAQIGEGNFARFDQTGADERARAVVRQEGEGNRADVTQSGAGGPTLELLQAGDDNILSAVQSGPQTSSLIAGQLGIGNSARIVQESVGALNAASVAQSGVGNQLSLEQSGSGNRAALSQAGSNNAMSASQDGAGNRLTWAQNGDGLPDLGVVQTGAMAVSITQSN